MGASMQRETVAGLRARPHTSVISRLSALTAMIGAGLSGRQGNLRGVDRGDPTVSWTGPTPGMPLPTAAIGAISAGRSGQRLPNPIVQDVALNTPTLDPYNALLLARMKRPA